MNDRDRNLHRIEAHFDRIEAALPSGVADRLRRLRQPGGAWVRIPAGIVLVMGGFLWFLPILGLWMLPLGVLLLTIDVPFLRGPTADALDWVYRRVKAWRERKPGTQPPPRQ